MIAAQGPGHSLVRDYFQSFTDRPIGDPAQTVSAATAGGLGTACACDLNRWVPWTLAGGRLGRRDQLSGRQAGLRLAVLGGLEGVELGVLAAEFHQLGVPALFDDPAVTQHVDPVRVPDAGHPVRDQQDTAAFGVLADG